MSRLLLFTTNYEAQLKSNAQSGMLDAYTSDIFPYDEKKTMPMNLEVDDDICESMWPMGQNGCFF